MKLLVLLVVLGVALIGGAWWSHTRSSGIGAIEHERFEHALARVRRLDSAFNEDVLRVRFRLLEDYDSLGQHMADLQQAMADLRSTPGFVEPDARAVIEAKLAELARLLDAKAEALESFKSHNAVLKNSVRYFPLAGGELVEGLAQRRNRTELEMLVDQLMAQALTYHVAPGTDAETHMQATLARLAAWRTAYPGDAAAVAVATLSIHAGTILKRRPKVDELLTRLISPDTRQLVLDTTALYEQQVSLAVRSVQRFRTVLYGLCGTLLGVIALTLYALRAANVNLERRRLDLAQKNGELQAARDQLEQRVVGRTRELDLANQALQAANEQLSMLALYDPLTGLPNRMLLEERMAQAAATAERSGKPFALMFVDLDRFKPVNDSFGHDVGDALLKAVAERLTGCVRKADTVARTGGDEFVAVLSALADPDDAAHVAAKMLAEVSRPFVIGAHALDISASIGIGVYPRDARDVNRLKVHADEAMYDAKRAGRSTYRFFTPAANDGTAHASRLAA